MAKPRALTDEQAEQLYQEYALWLSLSPKKLSAKYGISVDAIRTYGQRKHKTRKAA